MPHPGQKVTVSMSYEVAKAIHENSGERGERLGDIISEGDLSYTDREEAAQMLDWELHDAIKEAEEGDDENELAAA